MEWAVEVLSVELWGSEGVGVSAAPYFTVITSDEQSEKVVCVRRDGPGVKSAAALPEDLVQFPSTRAGLLTTICNFSSGGLDILFWPPWAPASVPA